MSCSRVHSDVPDASTARPGVHSCPQHSSASRTTTLKFRAPTTRSPRCVTMMPVVCPSRCCPGAALWAEPCHRASLTCPVFGLRLWHRTTVTFTSCLHMRIAENSDMLCSEPGHRACSAWASCRGALPLPSGPCTRAVMKQADIQLLSATPRARGMPSLPRHACSFQP